MKLIKLIGCFVLMHANANAQTEYSNIEINITNSLENIIKSKQFKNWTEVLADSTLKDFNYYYVIRDKKGRLVKPQLEKQIIRSISKNSRIENMLFAGLKGDNPGDGKVVMSMDFGQSRYVLIKRN